MPSTAGGTARRNLLHSQSLEYDGGPEPLMDRPVGVRQLVKQGGRKATECPSSERRWSKGAELRSRSDLVMQLVTDGTSVPRWSTRRTMDALLGRILSCRDMRSTPPPENSEHEVVLGMPAVVHSEAMRQLMQMARRVAQTSASVLITGESGVGKELVARALHHYSLRCNLPWVDINCGALPENLVESELFGYEKGAFSGADQIKQGLFELAHRGTLFLDEIGELDPKMQVKLLRVLDGVPYFRLGGVRKVSVDARIITATNHNLEEAIRAGKFRSDLYHRLSQVHLHVPALRERPEDITVLAEFFLGEHTPQMGITAEALEALQRYSWPGNVRELRNTVVRAAILVSDREIGVADLPAAVRDTAQATSFLPPTSLEQMERQMILQVLNQTGGHYTKAAEVLGISRRTLTRKLKLYGVEDACESIAAG